MKARRVRLPIILVVVLIMAVCGYYQLSRTGARVASPGRPVIFYDESGIPSERTPALSGAEIKKVLDRVATQTPDTVWLIWVRPSQIYEAYVVPDKETPRIRSGRVYTMRKSEQPMRVGSGGRYIQVCPPGREFTRKLTKPSVVDMPFEWPQIVDPNSRQTSPMPEEEVTAIADFARSPSNYKQLRIVPDKVWEDGMVRGIFQSPILRIERAGDRICVTFGFMHDALWGKGVDVEIECTPTGYKVVERSEWIS